MLRKLIVTASVVLLLLPIPLLAQDAPPLPRENGALLYSAAFNDKSGLEAAFGDDWMTYEAGGGIATIASTAPGVVLAAMIAGHSFGDFIAEVDLLPNPSPASIQYGFLFRADGPPDIEATTYNLIVDLNMNQLAMTTLMPGGRDEDIVDLGGRNLSDLTFDASKPNRLRLEAVGSTLRVFMNGDFAFEANDSALASGGFGLGIGSPSDLAPGATSSARFANLNLFAPGAEQAAPAAAPVVAPPAAPEAPVAAATQEPAPEAQSSGITGSVLAPNLNVRSGPGIGYDIVGKIKRGETVNVDARDANCAWLQVAGRASAGLGLRTVREPCAGCMHASTVGRQRRRERSAACGSDSRGHFNHCAGRKDNASRCGNGSAGRGTKRERH